MFICLCKFKIIQYRLKYKCICICILLYYTYSDTEYSAYLSILPECYSVYLVVFPSVPPLEGPFECLQGPNAHIVHPIEVYILNLWFLT